MVLINNRQLLPVHTFNEQPVKCRELLQYLSADIVVLVLSVLSSFVCAEMYEKNFYLYVVID